MTRVTSFNLPKKKFVSSAAEDSQAAEAGPSTTPVAANAQVKKGKKRRGRRGKIDPATGEPYATTSSTGDQPRPNAVHQKEDGSDHGKSHSGWKRDPAIAKRAKYAAERAEERRQKRQHQRESSTTCFACRGIGHSARECPNILLATEAAQGTAALLGDNPDRTQQAESSQNQEAGENGSGAKNSMKRKKGKVGADLVGGRCYRCNSTDHSLNQCTEPVDPTNPTPYATCYICLGQGHLSSLCPSNAGKGIYVNGGCCKVCGSTAHRAKDCPDDPRKAEEDSKGKRNFQRSDSSIVGIGAGADEDDFMLESRARMREGPGKVQNSDKKRGKKDSLAFKGLKGGPTVEAVGNGERTGQGDPALGDHTTTTAKASAPKPARLKAKPKIVSF